MNEFVFDSIMHDSYCALHVKLINVTQWNKGIQLEFNLSTLEHLNITSTNTNVDNKRFANQTNISLKFYYFIFAFPFEVACDRILFRFQNKINFLNIPPMLKYADKYDRSSLWLTHYRSYN